MTNCISKLSYNLSNYFQWYKQNRQLKRRSHIIAEKVLLTNPEMLPDLDLTDDVDSNDNDTERLRGSIKGKFQL